MQFESPACRTGGSCAVAIHFVRKGDTVDHLLASKGNAHLVLRKERGPRVKIPSALNLLA